MIHPVQNTHSGSRVLYADILRIVATFAIVVLHTATSEWYGVSVQSDHWLGLNFYNTLVRWGVAIFIMLSGAFFLDPHISRTPDKIFGKYIPRIAVALIFWGGLYGCFHVVSNSHFTAIDFLKVPLSFLFEPQVHLWFLYVIIGLYLLTPLLRIFTKHATKKELEYFLFLFVCFGTLLPLLSQYFLESVHQPLYRNLIIPGFSSFVGYFVAGYYFQHYSLMRKTRLLFYALGILSWAFIFLGSTQLSIEKNTPNEYLMGNFRPMTFAMATGIFLFAKEFLGRRTFGVRVERVVLWLSGCTFGIYLVHPLIISAFLKLGGNLYFISSFISVPLISCILFLVSLFITALIKKIPLIHKWIV